MGVQGGRPILFQSPDWRTSVSGCSPCDRANDVIRGSRRHLDCYFEGHRDLSSHQAGKMGDHLVRNLARIAAYPRGIKRNATSPFPGTSEVGNCVSYRIRTLGLSRGGCSRSETLSVHSCSIATQTPTPPHPCHDSVTMIASLLIHAGELHHTWCGGEPDFW